MSSRALQLGLALTVLPLLGGCGSAPMPAETQPGMVWPAESPRLRLERVIEIRREPSIRRFLRRVSGREPSDLFKRPFGTAWDDQDLLVADPGAGRVLRIDRRGRVTARSEQDFASPVGVAVCSAGVVVSDSVNGEIWLLDGRLTTARLVAGDLSRPTGVACMGDQVFVSETARHRVLVFALDSNGKVVAQRSIGERGDGPAQFNFPTAVTLARNSLWVGDTMNFRVQELDPRSGAFLSQFGSLGDAPGDMPRIKGLVVDSRGHLWISDAHLDQVWLYRPDGTFLMDLGRPGSEPGEFSFPAGVAAADGRVAVVDSLNRRIQVFRELVGDLPESDANEEASR